MTTYYVSNTTANGISIGSDSDAGSSASPFLTLDKALSVATDGDTIVLNNGTYTPAASTFDISSGVSIQSVVTGGATIDGSGGHTPISIDVADGSTVTLGAVNIDAQNTANAIALQSESTTFSLDLNGTHIANATGYAVLGQTNTQVNLTSTNVTYTANQSLGLFGLPSIAAGHIDIEGGSVTIADQMSGAAPSGGLDSAAIGQIDATTTGVTVHVNGVTANTTMDASDTNLVGALMVMNVANALIENNNITVSGAAASARGIDVAYDLTTPLDSSGAIIRNNTVQNFNTGGGVLIIVGEDGSPGATLWGYADNAQIYSNTGTGNTASQAAGLHGVLVGWQSGAIIHNNEMDSTDLAYVMKGDFGTTVVYDNLDKNTRDKSWYQKGGSGVEWLSNASDQATGYKPSGVYVGEDSGETAGVYTASGGIALNNTVWYTGAAGTLTYVEPGSSVDVISSTNEHSNGALTSTGQTFSQFLSSVDMNATVSMTAAQLEELTALNISNLPLAGITGIKLTDAKPVFTLDENTILAFGLGGIKLTYTGGTTTFSAPSGSEYTVLETDTNASHVVTDRIYAGFTTGEYSESRFDYNSSGIIIDKIYSGMNDTIYTSYRDDYSSTGVLLDQVFSGIAAGTGEPYTTFRCDYYSSGVLEDEIYSSITTEPYSSYNYNYNTSGVMVSHSFNWTSGSGEPYTFSRYDYDTGGNLTDVYYSGFTTTTYLTSQFYYNLSGNLVSQVYTGSIGTAYTGVELDYNTSGDMTDKIYNYNNKYHYFMLEPGSDASTTINGFSTAHSDRIYLTDILTGHYDPAHDAIANFVSLATSGSNTVVSVDLDGPGSSYSMTPIGTIEGVTGLSLATLISHHNLIVPT